jgi:hypothetical protein
MTSSAGVRISYYIHFLETKVIKGFTPKTQTVKVEVV